MTGLTCSTEDWEPEPGMKCWDWPSDYMPMPQFKRRRRCCSCGKLLNPGETVISWECEKIPNTDVEVAIYGEEGAVPLATRYACERCADIGLSLMELGYSFAPGDNAQGLLAEYQAMSPSNKKPEDC